jgi:DNA-binding MarR family transcriptional regulator
MPDLDVTPLLVVGRVQRLATRWDALLREPFAREALAPGDFDVLAALRRQDGPLTPARLADAMLVTAGAVTKRVDRLIDAELVSRTRSADDGRGRVIELTARGRRLTERLMREHLANESRLLTVLDSRERQLLADLLSRLLVDVEQTSP